MYSHDIQVHFPRWPWWCGYFVFNRKHLMRFQSETFVFKFFLPSLDEAAQISETKYPSQPPTFSMPLKLLMLSRYCMMNEAKYYCFDVSCVAWSYIGLIILNSSVISLSFDMLGIKYNSPTLAYKQKTKVWVGELAQSARYSVTRTTNNSTTCTRF